MIYAVGIGPGDPDMMPYKTVKLLNTAAMGMAYRAAGNKMKVFVLQFIKGK
jgi:precorrin-2 methylase